MENIKAIVGQTYVLHEEQFEIGSIFMLEYKTLTFFTGC